MDTCDHKVGELQAIMSYYKNKVVQERKVPYMELCCVLSKYSSAFASLTKSVDIHRTTMFKYPKSEQQFTEKY